MEEVGLASNAGPDLGIGQRSNSLGRDKSNNTNWVMVKGKGTNRPKGDEPTQNRRNGPRNRGFKHLSYQEIMERRKKGQCFKCKGPFFLTKTHLTHLINNNRFNTTGNTIKISVTSPRNGRSC
jgi:hypothetical protein